VDYFSISEWKLASGQAVVLELAGEACTPFCHLEYCCAMEMNLCLNIGSEDRNGVSANSYLEIKKKKHVHTLLVLYPE
jgi:predicted metal-binding transcription factor (methanogenesis marker protein 9)